MIEKPKDVFLVPLFADDQKLRISQIIAHWNRLSAFIWPKIVSSRENARFRLYRRKIVKNRKYTKIVNRPLIRRRIVDFRNSLSLRSNQLVDWSLRLSISICSTQLIDRSLLRSLSPRSKKFVDQPSFLDSRFARGN